MRVIVNPGTGPVEGATAFLSVDRDTAASWIRELETMLGWESRSDVESDLKKTISSRNATIRSLRGALTKARRR